MNNKATITKGEQAVVVWKASLSRDLRNFEEKVDQLYSIVGLQTSTIIGSDEDEGNKIHQPDFQFTGKNADYKTLVDEIAASVNSTAQNISSSISAQTEFVLPIPVYVLLRLASKVGSIRWKDYNKKPTGLAKNHVYSLSGYFIQINMNMFKSVIRVLASNIIPFTPFINQTVMKILDWTRSSGLFNYDTPQYYKVRIQQFRMLSFMIEQLSLNINLEPYLLKTLLEDELISDEDKSGELNLLESEHKFEAWTCLEKVLETYSGLLDSALEHKVKSHVIHKCLGIYRDFAAARVISPKCRKQLLNLLAVIANQPLATSTTEISMHVLELAGKIESDPDIRSFARSLLRRGLAHRPIIVSHYDVCRQLALPMQLETTEHVQVSDDQGIPMQLEASEPLKEIENHAASKEAAVTEADHATDNREAAENLETSKSANLPDDHGMPMQSNISKPIDECNNRETVKQVDISDTIIDAEVSNQKGQNGFAGSDPKPNLDSEFDNQLLDLGFQDVPATD